jgi:hypothetical protein
MNTELFLGYNVAKIGFKYIGTYTVFGNYSINQVEGKVNTLFENTTAIYEANYSIEKYTYYKYLHAHLLFNADNDELLNTEIINYIKPKRVDEDINKRIMKILKNENDLKTDVQFKDEYISTHFKNYIGSKMELYIEKVHQDINASIYVHKQCSYGIINGYFKR